METFKIKHFQVEYPGRPFPWFHQLVPAQCAILRQRVAERLRLPPSVGGLALMTKLDSICRDIGSFDPNAETPDLSETMSKVRLAPPDLVYLNWDQFETVDQMRFADLSANLASVWYPASDDLDIFDETMTWLISLRHYGGIRVARLTGRQKPTEPDGKMG